MELKKKRYDDFASLWSGRLLFSVKFVGPVWGVCLAIFLVASIIEHFVDDFIFTLSMEKYLTVVGYIFYGATMYMLGGLVLYGIALAIYRTFILKL